MKTFKSAKNPIAPYKKTYVKIKEKTIQILIKLYLNLKVKI